MTYMYIIVKERYKILHIYSVPFVSSTETVGHIAVPCPNTLFRSIISLRVCYIRIRRCHSNPTTHNTPKK